MEQMTREEVEKKIQAQLSELVKLPLVGSAEFFVGFIRAFESLELLAPHDSQAWIERGASEIVRALVEKGVNNGKRRTVELGRFGHHSDPAVDFGIEVADIEGLIEDHKVGLDPRKPIEDRIFKAMQFEIGGAPGVVVVKEILRKLEAKFVKCTE